MACVNHHTPLWEPTGDKEPVDDDDRHMLICWTEQIPLLITFQSFLTSPWSVSLRQIAWAELQFYWERLASFVVT